MHNHYSTMNAAGAREMCKDSSRRSASQGVSLLCTFFNTLDHQKAITLEVLLCGVPKMFKQHSKLTAMGLTHVW